MGGNVIRLVFSLDRARRRPQAWCASYQSQFGHRQMSALIWDDLGWGNPPLWGRAKSTSVSKQMGVILTQNQRTP